VRLAEGAAV